MSPVCGFLSVLATVILSGALGGLRNFLEEQAASDAKLILFFRRFVEAILAAAVVPLFLSIIGNNIIADLLSPTAGSNSNWLSDWLYAILKLLGFCIVASLYSRKFLDTVSARVLNLEKQVKETKQEAQKATQGIELLTNAVVESDDQPAPASLAQLVVAPPAAEHGQQILKAFLTAGVPVRSVQGLSLSTNLPHDQVATCLSELEKQTFVRSIETPKGIRWVLTPAGRKVLGDI
ncbi:MAG: hypothetical protein KGJ66_07065 [Alphaproteobacteria bacterium]|nr:hypothetical protein [Alphaproteobacteria bacterium]